MVDRKITTKNFILDLLRMMESKAISIKGLIFVGNLFGFRENAVRVAVTRLVREGLVESDERGFYHLTPSTNSFSQFIESWHLGEKRRALWDQRWLICHLPRNSQRTERNSSLKALELCGYEVVEGCCEQPCCDNGCAPAGCAPSAAPAAPAPTSDPKAYFPSRLQDQQKQTRRLSGNSLSNLFGLID